MRKLFYTILVAFIVLGTVSSCKKDKKSSTNTAPSGAIVLWPNVHVVDSTQWILEQNSVTPGDGNYRYTFTPATPAINVKVGDIIIGATNGGYIRKVTSITISGAYYILATEQASMAQVFKSGSFNVQVPFNDPNQGTPGVLRTYTNYKLYHNNTFAITLLNAQLNIQPTYNLAFAFDSAAGLTNFQMSASNITATDSISYNVKGIMPSSWVSDTTMGSFTGTNIQMVQAWTTAGYISVPVVVKLGLNYIAKTNGSNNYANDTINTSVTWASSNVFSGGLQYQAAQWQPIHNYTVSNTVAFGTILYDTHVGDAYLTFYSQINSWLYGVTGPQITTGLSGYFQQRHTSPAAPFHHKTQVWSVYTDAQVGNSIVAPGMGVFTQTWTSDSTLFQSPYTLTKISGDNQTANVVSTLPNPLVVKITDTNGQPVVNVKVTFAVAANDGGTLSAYTLLTDVNGLAQVTWTLGPPIRNQTITVNAYDGYGLDLNGAPAVFTATGQ